MIHMKMLVVYQMKRSFYSSRFQKALCHVKQATAWSCFMPAWALNKMCLFSSTSDQITSVVAAGSTTRCYNSNKNVPTLICFQAQRLCEPHPKRSPHHHEWDQGKWAPPHRRLSSRLLCRPVWLFAWAIDVTHTLVTTSWIARQYTDTGAAMCPFSQYLSCV